MHSANALNSYKSPLDNHSSHTDRPTVAVHGYGALDVLQQTMDELFPADHRSDIAILDVGACTGFAGQRVRYYSPPNHHLSLNRVGRRGTTDDFTTISLHFSVFSTALWHLANSKPVHSLMLSSSLFFCLPRFFPLSLCLAR